MNIETKEIGIDIGVGIGKFHNTEFIDGVIQLKKANKIYGDKNYYEFEGYWESKVIDLVDKFREYDRVALSKKQETRDNYVILTRVSDNGVDFDDYVATTPEGKVQSEMKRFIQIKIVFFAGLLIEEKTLHSFESENEIENWENNKYITIDSESHVLKIKKDYNSIMEKDTAWSEDGTLHRKLISRNEWKRIDSLSVDDL